MTDERPRRSNSKQGRPGGPKRGGSSSGGKRGGRGGSGDGRGRDRDGGKGRGSRDGHGGRSGRSERDGSRGRGGRSRDDRTTSGGSSRGGPSRGPRGRDDRGGSGRDGGSGRGGRSGDDRGARGRGRGSRDGRGRDDRWRRDRDEGAGPQEWGGLARRGAARLNDEASERDLRDAGEHVHEDAPDFDEDEEVRARREQRQAKRAAGEANRERLRNEARAAIARAGGPGEPRAEPEGDRRTHRHLLVPRKLPDPKFQLTEMLGRSAGGRAWTDLTAAADHVEAGRAGEARPLALALYRKTPEILEVAEVWGLTLYQLGQWREAIEVLEEVRILSGSPDNNPVLADAHRAVGNHDDVAWLWNELREASPASEIMTEGRIVAAGSLADKGDVGAAVRLLEKGFKRPKRPFEHHLRRAYALADLYERAGERPRAKELFGWIAHHEAGYADAAERSR